MTNSRSRQGSAPDKILSNSIKERKDTDPLAKSRKFPPTDLSFFQSPANKSSIQIPAELFQFNEVDRSIDLEFPIAETWQGKHKNMEKQNSTSIPDLDEAVSTARNIQYDPRTAMRPLEGSRLVIVVFTLVFGLFLSTVETSITATALVSIGIYFGDSSMTSWVVLSYLLTYMGFSVIFARLSDAIGRKSAILLSWFLFAVFSLASGLATSLTQLIIFRSFQGIGGSGLFTMAMTVAPQVTPAKYWGALSGALGAALACSSLAGPVLGGVITQKVGWRWIYLYNAPIAVVMIIPFLIAWPKSPSRDDQPKGLLLSQIDVPGALLLLAASTLLVFALDQGGGYRLTWTGPIILSSLIVSAVCWVLFVGWISFIETGKCKINIKPIFPLKSAIARPIGPAIIMSFLTGIPFFIVMINLPIRFQLLNGNSPTMAGVHLMPLLAMSALGSAVGGLLSINKNRTYYTLVVASTLMCIGTGLLSRIPLSREIPPQQYLYQAILGFSIGLSLSSITVMTGLASDFASVASVNGAVNQARVLGGSIGLSIANIILNNMISSELAPILTPTEIKDLRQSLSTIIDLEPPKQIAVVRVFANSFNSQMLVCLYLSVAGFFIVHFTWQKEPASVEAHKEQQQAMANN
ncbi:Efflux pump dotC [Golovinomyces cichoracearum]|uniref:Efflux pump dotC n=1 Tax=Golovinomyces cichoracearum TaxID=62708 RepID=A0A420IRZ1_9PEZI|nr:Efflux pump dotC [Golovinomyces cichoracearum]